jgi:glutathione S-transferase
MVRGFTVCGCPSALRKNRLAASASRLAESRKSLGEYPNLSAYVARGGARPAYKRAFAAQLVVFIGNTPTA